MPAVPAKLKVYRTAVGFRDAYVAAPSQAAALRAWGTEKNLFTRGAAEVVDDPALVEEPLSRPGEVVYRTRGSLAEQVAALGELPARKSRTKKPGNVAAAAEAPKKPPRAPRPRPSRGALDAAEKAIRDLEGDHERAQAELRERERALAREKAAIEARFAERLDRLREEEERARAAYDKALRGWEP